MSVEEENQATKADQTALKKASPQRKIPACIRDQLRGRYGLEKTDSSLDNAIAELSPAEMVREAVAYELGDPIWAGRIAGFMRATGASPDDF